MAERTAIITGGGSGIGRAAALDLARSGFRIVVSGRREELLRSTAEEIKELGGKALAVPCDVRDPDQVNSMFNAAVDHFGNVDTLINNAGGQFPAMAENISPRGWNAVVSTNLTGTFYCCQNFARIVERDGVITNMTIPWYDRGCAGLSHAVAARAGVVALTKSLALEWAPRRIRVNCIAPGMVVTQGMIDEELDGEVSRIDELVRAVPLRRTASPKEIAGVIAFMISDAASYMTGHTLVVDGGVMLGSGFDFTTHLNKH